MQGGRFALLINNIYTTSKYVDKAEHASGTTTSAQRIMMIHLMYIAG